MELCFSCFTVQVLKDFRVMTVARERSRLVPPKAAPMGRPTPLANAAIEVPPVITVNVIRHVSTIPVIVLNRFIFLAIRSRTSISSRKNVSIQLIFAADMFVVLLVLKGLNLDKFWYHCRIYSCSLFYSCR